MIILVALAIAAVVGLSFLQRDNSEAEYCNLECRDCPACGQ
jgi:hypothetical protein